MAEPLYQGADGCYESLDASAHSYAAKNPIFSRQTYSGHETCHFSWYGNGIAEYNCLDSIGNPSNYLRIQYPQKQCLAPPPLNYEDAQTVGWAIATAWLAVYAITFLTRYIARETHERDTNVSGGNS